MFPINIFARFSYVRGFVAMIHELYDMAGQHDMVADNLNAEVMTKLLTCIQELKQDRKKVDSEIYFCI